MYYLMGDIHGDYKPIRDFYERNKDTLPQNETNTIILLGDAGLNFYFNYKDRNLKIKLGKYPFEYFIVRGNHEQRPSICAAHNPGQWTQKEMYGGFVYIEKEYPYIKYASDDVSNYLLVANNQYYSVLVIPGAYSIDRDFRLAQHWPWFPNEQLSFREMKEGFERIKRHNNKYDLVLSHTCPLKYQPTDLFISSSDQIYADNGMEQYLDMIEEDLDYKAWVFAHYHTFRDYPRTDGRARTILYNDCALELGSYMRGEINKL